MQILGYITAILIGISLGLIGGGGSILTVPVLVYLMGVPAVEATAYSLFIVGISSFTGSIRYYRQGNVDMRSVLLFGLPSIVSVIATRRYLLPLIPENIVTVGNFTVTKNILLMLVFAVLMLFAAIRMIRSGKKPEATDTQKKQTMPLILQGLFVGAVTGFLGAGGGFLIIPALVLFNKLPMKMAVGTSLAIITINSLIGFFSSLSGTSPDWQLLLIFSAIAIAGIFVGTYLAQKINGAALKKGFGWFVLIMGAFILIKELFFQ